MHKCFSYPLKAENKEAFLHPCRLLGRGPQLFRAETLLPHPAAEVLGKGRGSEDLGDSWSWEARKGISGRSWDRWSDGLVS